MGVVRGPWTYKPSALWSLLGKYEADPDLQVSMVRQASCQLWRAMEEINITPVSHNHKQNKNIYPQHGTYKQVSESNI